MMHLAVNERNDIFIDKAGNLALSEGAEAVAQDLAHAMQTLYGEMLFAADRGLPYKECVWVTPPNIRQFESFARVALEQRNHVRAVQSFSTRIEDDVLHYAVTVMTDFGEVSING